MKQTRTLISYLGLLASVLISHLVGQGSFISLPSVLLFSLLILAILMLAIPVELAGPKLALLVLVAQVFGHFLFGGSSQSSSANSSLMFLSHLIGGLLGYQIISKLDGLWDLLRDLLKSLTLPLKIELIQIQVPEKTFINFPNLQTQVERFLQSAFLLRAPPFAK